MQLCLVLAPLDPEQPLTALVPDDARPVDVRSAFADALAHAGWPALANYVAQLPVAAFWLTPCRNDAHGVSWAVVPRPEYVLQCPARVPA